MRLRLFLGIFSVESRRLMSYRADFWVTAAMNLVAAILVPYFLWGAMYGPTTNTLGGFTFEGMVTYVCLVALIGRVVRGGDQIGDVAEDIYQGSLNRYLVYPTGYLPFKYAQHLGNLFPHFLQLFVFVPLLLLIVGIPEDIDVTIPSILMAVVAIGVGNLLFYLLAFPLQVVAFWADNVWSLSVMLRMGSRLLGGALVPLSLFPEWSRGTLDLLPFVALYHLPVTALMGKLTVVEWAQGITISLMWCVVTYVVGRVLWKRGTLMYSGVGI